MKIVRNDNKCPHCGEIIYGDFYKYLNHVQRCNCNPKLSEINEQRSEKYKKYWDNKLGNLITKTFICENCGKEFTRDIHENSSTNELIIKHTRFCSSFCAHSFVAKQTSKINKTKITTCCKCGKEYEVSKYFCTDKYHICKECTDEINEEKRQKRLQKRLNKEQRNKKQHKHKAYKNVWIKYNLDLSNHDNILAIRRAETKNIYYKKHNWQCKEIQPYQCPICGTYHCSDVRCKQWNTQSINTLVKYFNFDTSKIGTLDFYTELDKIKQYLYDEYCVKKVPLLFIAKKHNAIDKTVYNLLVKFGIEKINHKYINFKHGYHKTWEGKQVYLRSSYEFNYAYFLDENKIHYEVESLKIKYFDTQIKRIRTYTPDFYIPSINTIIEIKGNITYDEQNIKDKFIGCVDAGYNVKLIYGPKMKEKNIVL